MFQASFGLPLSEGCKAEENQTHIPDRFADVKDDKDEFKLEQGECSQAGPTVGTMALVLARTAFPFAFDVHLGANMHDLFNLCLSL